MPSRGPTSCAGTQNTLAHTVGSLRIRRRRLRKPAPHEGFANPARQVSADLWELQHMNIESP